MGIIFLEPILKEMPWGGDNLKKELGFESNLKNIGETWCISAHENGDCIVKNGKFEGMTLSELFEKQRHLFGNITTCRFPLLIKIIDAKEDLSIQVHPEDEYAKVYENGSFGKTECWYILDCEDNAEIVIGHKAKTKEELEALVLDKRWDELINTVPVKKGDFFQINPGIVHAIKGGIMILEIQQSSDITYRLYDYDRIVDGKKRELHIQKALDVIKVPFDMNECRIEDFNQKQSFSCSYYEVWRMVIKGSIELDSEDCVVNAFISDGTGAVNGIEIKRGESFLIPSGIECKIVGKMEIIFSKAK